MTSKRILWIATLLLMAASAQFLTARPALAADGVVNPCTDAELRAELQALQNGSGGTLTFGCGTAAITLTGGALPTITKNTTINGGGSITLSGNNAARLFVVNPGATLTLNGLVITRGYADGDGGAILNNGTLRVNNSKFTENQTDPNHSGGAIVSYGPLEINESEFTKNKGGNGGAVYPRFSPAVTTIRNTTFKQNETLNTSSGWGGALLLWDGAPVTIESGTFTKNVSLNRGGAIFTQGASSLHISESKFAKNSTTGLFGEGGAIAVEGPLTLTDTLFKGNHSSRGGGISIFSSASSIFESAFKNNWGAYGGGIRQNGGTLSVTNSAFTRNGYKGVNKVNTGGGALSFDSGSATISHSTFDGNFASYGAAADMTKGSASFTNVTMSGNEAVGGAAIDQGGGATTLMNVTIYGNKAGFFGALSFRNGTMTVKNTVIAATDGIDNCYGNITSTGFNLSDDDSCAARFNQAGDKNGAQYNPLLAPLANNGGPTKTHLPQAGSPLINSGTGVGGTPNNDQRGISRPQGLANDIGAVEVCAKPQKPVLIEPTNGTQVKPQVNLDWDDAECATSYKVIVKQGSKNGTNAFTATVTPSQAKTTPLVSGQTYFWRIIAVNLAGKTRSGWQNFKIK